MDPDLNEKWSSGDLRIQFKRYIAKLVQISSESDVCSDSLSLLGKLLNPELNHFQDIEGILSILARAAVSKSVESIVESRVSTVEHHSNAYRGLEQYHLEDEMTVAINGPPVHHSGGIVRAAMKVH